MNAAIFNLEQGVLNIGNDEISGQTSVEALQEIFKSRVKETSCNGLAQSYRIESLPINGQLFDLVFKIRLSGEGIDYIDLVRSDGEYKKAGTDWDKITDEAMLKREVKALSRWVRSIEDVNPTKELPGGYLWEYDWGYVAALYEIKSYGCGIYIVWNPPKQG